MNIFVVMMLFLLNQALIAAVKPPRQTQTSRSRNSYSNPVPEPRNLSIQGKSLNLQPKTTSVKKALPENNPKQSIPKFDDQEDSLPVKKPKTFSEVIDQSSKKMQDQSYKIQQEDRARFISNEERTSRNPRGRISISPNEMKNQTRASSKSTDRNFANSTKNSGHENIATTQNMLPSHPLNIEARLSSSQNLAASILDSD